MRFGKKDEEAMHGHSRHLAAKKSSLDELMQFARGGMGHELKQSLHGAPTPEGSPEEEAHESPGVEAHEDIPGVNEDPADLQPRHASGPPPGDTSRTVPRSKPSDHHEAIRQMLEQMKAGKRRG